MKPSKIMSSDEVGRLLSVLRLASLKVFTKIEARGISSLSQEDRRVISDCHLISLLSLTGLRISEALSLKESDIGDGYIIVRKEVSKNGREGCVFYGEKTGAVIHQIRSIKRLSGSLSSFLFPPRARSGESPCLQSRSYAAKRFKFWLRRAQLPDRFSLHSLRHFYATHALENGVPLSTVRFQLRHSSISVTSQYLHFTSEAKEALTKLF